MYERRKYWYKPVALLGGVAYSIAEGEALIFKIGKRMLAANEGANSQARGKGGFLVFFCRDVSDVTDPWGDGRFGGLRMRSMTAAAPLNSWLSSTEAASKRARDAGDGARRGFVCRSARSDSE